MPRWSPAKAVGASLALMAAVTVAPYGTPALADGGRAVRAGMAPATPDRDAAVSRAGATITGGSVGIPQDSSAWGPGDTWYNTWAADGNIYATSDDANGFSNTCNSNFTVNELTGNDPSELRSPYVNCMTGYGRAGQLQGYHDGRTWKTDGVISVDGTLYVVVARQVDGYGGYPVGYQSSADASIIKSTDDGRTWSNSFGGGNDPDGAPPPPRPGGGAEAMFPGTSFSTAEFINYGQDDAPASTADGGSQYVYALSNDGWSYDGSYMILGRVPRDKIGDLNAADWQYYTGPPGGNGLNAASWSGNVSQAAHIISAPHQLSQSGVQYIAGLHRYVLTSFYFPFNAEWSAGGMTAYTTWSFYEAPHPWGPWTPFYRSPTIECYFTCDPSSASPIGLYDPALVSKFINMNGLSDVVFSSGDWQSRYRPDGNLYSLHAFPLTLSTAARQVVDDSRAGNYAGNWIVSYQQGGYYADTIHDSQAAGATVSYAFTGNSIAWVGGKNENHGYADVSVDGAPAVPVDTYAPQWAKQQVLYERDGLSYGTHTLTITVTARKDAGSAGTYQDVDAFIIGR